MEATSSGGTTKTIQLLEDAIHQLSLNPFPPSLNQIEFHSQNLTSPTANICVDESQILTKLISQLESLKEDGIIKYSDSSADANVEESSSAVDGNADSNEEAVAATSGTEAEEIVKELRIVKRQNTVTHWLLSGLILLTLTWQLSEVSLILKVRDRLNHPFSTLWSWFSGGVRRPSAIGQDTEKQASSIKDSLVESASQSLKLTNDTISHLDLELPHVQLPNLLSGKDK